MNKGISNSKYNLWLVTRGIPQRVTLGSILIKTFTNDQNNGMVGTLSKFVTDTKLCKVVHALQDCLSEVPQQAARMC